MASRNEDACYIAVRICMEFWAGVKPVDSSGHLQTGTVPEYHCPCSLIQAPQKIVEKISLRNETWEGFRLMQRVMGRKEVSTS